MTLKKSKILSWNWKEEEKESWVGLKKFNSDLKLCYFDKEKQTKEAFIDRLELEDTCRQREGRIELLLEQKVRVERLKVGNMRHTNYLNSGFRGRKKRGL